MSDTTPVASFSRLYRISRKIRPPVHSKRASIKPPTFHNILFHRRNVPRSKYYLTSGHEHLGKSRNVNEEQSPFAIPLDTHFLAYGQCWKAWTRQEFQEKRKANYKNAHSYKTLQARDILQRLRLDVEIEAEEAKKHKDLNKAIAMTDVDPQYFTELRHRVVKDRTSLQRYIEDIREVLRTRLLAGQERDDCIRIDQQFEEELKRLGKIKRKYRQYVTGFEEFLSKDHEESMDVLRKAEEQTKITKALSATRNQLSKEFGQVRLEVYFWEEAWRMVKMCQTFLYQVSPISWRTRYDWIHRPESGISIVSAKNEDLFGRFRKPDEVASLDSLIEMFEQDIANAEPPQMYFNDPFDLLYVFRTMELQNLNALLHLESLTGPMAEMTTNIAEAERQIKREISEIIEGINDLEANICWEEKRAANLENYANYLLKGVFRNLVCSEEVLYLRIFVEDTYENCVAPNDANLDSFSMMRSIEKIHEELNMELDSLPVEVVISCEKDGFKQEMKTMKEAEDASRKLELMRRLLAALKRIMEPPKMKRKQLMRRSAPIEPKPKIIPPPPPLTNEEMQYLTFFTSYCQQDDQGDLRSQIPADFDLNFQGKVYENIEEINEEKTSD